jgi:hypothetical protein
MNRASKQNQQTLIKPIKIRREYIISDSQIHMRIHSSIRRGAALVVITKTVQYIPAKKKTVVQYNSNEMNQSSDQNQAFAWIIKPERNNKKKKARIFWSKREVSRN